MARHSEEWFWHTLALALGGRTVAEWQAVMTQREFARWVEYYRAHPFDDLHRHLRPAALVAAKAGGGDVRELLEWLEPGDADGLTDADVRTMRAFGFRPSDRG